MIAVRLVCGRNGALRRCEAKGHAAFASRGKDIVCAGVSVVLRTAVAFLDQTDGVSIQKEDASRGRLFFLVESADEAALERLRCVADFIRIGLRDLSDEYPRHVQMSEFMED